MALLNSYTLINVTNFSFFNNKAIEKGGGIFGYNFPYQEISLESYFNGFLFEGNNADLEGGGLYF